MFGNNIENAGELTGTALELYTPNYRRNADNGVVNYYCMVKEVKICKSAAKILNR